MPICSTRLQSEFFLEILFAEAIFSEPLRLFLSSCIKIIKSCARETMKTIVNCDFLTPGSTWCSDLKTINIHEDMANVHLSCWLLFCEKRKCNCRWKISLAPLNILIENIGKLLTTLSMLFFEESVSLIAVLRSIISRFHHLLFSRFSQKISSLI